MEGVERCWLSLRGLSKIEIEIVCSSRYIDTHPECGIEKAVSSLS